MGAASTVGELGLDPQELVELMRERHRRSPGGAHGVEAVASGWGPAHRNSSPWRRWTAQDRAVPARSGSPRPLPRGSPRE